MKRGIFPRLQVMINCLLSHLSIGFSLEYPCNVELFRSLGQVYSDLLQCNSTLHTKYVLYSKMNFKFVYVNLDRLSTAPA